MDRTDLDAISKEFGLRFSEKRKWNVLRGTISRTWKAAAGIARRPQQSPHPQWCLPLELLEQVVDHLHDELPTLRNCALVSHALVLPARRHLFNRILITGKNFVNTVLLFVKNPHLTCHVRELYFEAGDGTAFGSLQALLEGKQPPKHLRVFALVIAPRLPNVMRLTFKDAPFDQHIVAMFASHFPRLHTISLFDCWFRCNANLDTLIRGHPLIHTMRCGRLCAWYSSRDLAEQPGTKVTLRSLKITESDSSSSLTLIPWLVAHVNPEIFIYSLYQLSQVVELNNAIAALATLQHLHLTLPRWRKDDTRELIKYPEVAAIMPHYPPRIITLTLDARLHSLLLVVYIIAQLDPHSFSRLSTVHIFAHIQAEDVEAIDTNGWAGMDRTLSVLRSLGMVKFVNVCNDTTHVETGIAAVLKRLPLLNMRKVLSFVAQKHSK